MPNTTVLMGNICNKPLLYIPEFRYHIHNRLYWLNIMSIEMFLYYLVHAHMHVLEVTTRKYLYEPNLFTRNMYLIQSFIIPFHL